MVVDNLDVVGITISPGETDSPVLIDPNAVLSHSIPCQLFQAIGRGYLQIVEGTSVVEHAQFTQGSLLDFGRQPARALTGEDRLCLTILE